MTAPRKPTARELWEAIDEASFRAEVDRIVGMSDDKLEAELRKDGFDSAELAGHEPITERANKRPEDKADRPLATVRPLRRPRIVAWLAAAAAIGVIALVFAAKRNELISLFRHAPIAPLPTQEWLPKKPPDLELTRQEHASALRNEGFAACGRAAWTLCESKLNDAQAIDPNGEQDLSVAVARKMIYIARHPDAALFEPDSKVAPDAGRR